MKKILAFLSIAALAFATVACNPEDQEQGKLPSAAGIVPVVTVDGSVATFSLPAGTTGLVPIWYTNESGDFVFAGNGNNFQKTFFDAGTFKVRMYVSNSVGQSSDYSEASFTVEGQAGWNGYNYNSQYNIWKVGEDAGMDKSYTYYNPGWAAEKTLAFTINPYKLSLSDACGDRWQAQLHLVPGADVALSAEKHYDFSCIVKLNKPVGMTVKVVQQGDDNLFLFDQVEDTPAGDNVFWMKDIAGVDAASIKVVFDFGYCEAGTEIEISRITLKDHANDDGTSAPDKTEPEPPVDDNEYPADNYVFDANGAGNLWKTAIGHEKFYYYSCNGAEWNGVDTETTDVPFLVKNGNSYAITYANATTSQWQNQFFIFPNEGSFIPLSADKKYALQVKFSADQATPGFINFKQYGPDGPKHEGAGIYEYGSFNIEPGKDTVITFPIIKDVTCDNIHILMDFGGNPAGVTITIKDICLQEYNK